jgi:glutathione peroxidase-family protein
MAFGKIKATPTNFLISADGKIIQRFVGIMDIDSLRSKIKKLLQT